MKVLKFYTKSKTDKVERVIWYIQDRTPRSSILRRVEQYVRVNEMICIMSVAQLYQERADFDKEEKDKEFAVPKSRVSYLIIGEE
jgi:hypothetical protein